MPREFNKGRNCTLTEYEKSYLIENYSEKDCVTIAKELNISYGRLIVNASILGLEKNIPKPTFDRNGFFNEDEFFKQYKF
jgi:hypothetical protein